MIRPGRSPRADSACSSADVLTPTERAAAATKPTPKNNRIHNHAHVPHETLTYRDYDMKWGDVPHIRKALLTLAEKKR